MKMKKMEEKFILSPSVKHGFYCDHFHDTHYVQRHHAIVCTKRHPNTTANVESTGIHSFTHLRRIWVSVNEPISTKSRMLYSFIGSFAYTRKTPISFVLSVCQSADPSVPMYQHSSYSTDFREIFILATFKKICSKNSKISLKLDNISGTLHDILRIRTPAHFSIHHVQ